MAHGNILLSSDVCRQPTPHDSLCDSASPMATNEVNHVNTSPYDTSPHVAPEMARALSKSIFDACYAQKRTVGIILVSFDAPARINIWACTLFYTPYIAPHNGRKQMGTYFLMQMCLMGQVG